MQIHELNSFVGAPAGGDFLAIDSGFDTAKISADQLLGPTKAIAQGAEDALKLKVNIPKDGDNNPDNGTTGQLLRTNGDGSTNWVDQGLPSDEQTERAVSDWLDAHPEATTTVQDGSITEVKLAEILADKVNVAVGIDNYKHLVTGNDWTAALQAATDENDTVIVNHDIVILGTVSIEANHTIILDAIEVSKPADAPNTDPIFFLGKAYASLIGSGTGTTVRSYVDSPDGVVKIGAVSNTEITETVIYCTVRDMTIRGAANSGTNIGLHLCGTFDTQTYFASYFHFVSNLVIHTCAMGIVFNNAANANIVDNIQFWSCGYSRTTGAFCFIRTQGAYSIQKIPLENVITNAFHHNSANATTLYFGTALGYNRIDNIVCEQGGADSHVYVIDTGEIVSSLRNTIKYTNNSNAGVVSSDEFRQKNTIESQGSYRNSEIVADNNLVANGTLMIDGIEYHGNGAINYVIGNDSGLYENTEYSIGKIPAISGSQHQGALVRLLAVTSSGSLQLLNRFKSSLYRVDYNGAGDANKTITEVGTSEGTLDLTIQSDGTIRMKLPNNGTSTHNTDVRIYLEVFGYFPGSGITLQSGFSRMN